MRLEGKDRGSKDSSKDPCDLFILLYLYFACNCLPEIYLLNWPGRLGSAGVQAAWETKYIFLNFPARHLVTLHYSSRRRFLAVSTVPTDNMLYRLFTQRPVAAVAAAHTEWFKMIRNFRIFSSVYGPFVDIIRPSISLQNRLPIRMHIFKEYTYSLTIID